MVLTRPWAIDSAFPNAADQRKQLAAIYPREGVFPDATTIAAAGIAYAGAGWAVGARAFVAALKRGGAAYSQTYGTALVSNDGTVAAAWTVGAAPASGSRIDRLCIRARDTTQGDSATGAPADGPGGVVRAGIPEFIVVAGVAGTPGVAPALPAGHEEIAQITVPAAAVSSAGATIVQTYSFAQVVGGTIYGRTLTELNALTGAIEGDDAVATTTGVRYNRVGTLWKPAAPEPDLRNTFDTGAIAHGATITTFSIPAVTYATTVVIEYIGQAGNAGAAAGTFLPAFSTVGGTLTESPVGAYNAAAGEWIAVPRDAILALPANTAATVTVKSASTQNGIWRGSAVARRSAS